MSNVPEGLKYSKEHEWIVFDGDLRGRIGITDYAQHSLSDVVYVELPSVGDDVQLGASFAVVESVKSASDIYSPVAGKVAAVNEELEDHPEYINEDPYGKGWIVKLEFDSELNDLLDSKAYTSFLDEL